ncbi:hypothetical protein Acor_65740 [Acrocarpospora corrugata]|uniref:HTH cro/C1-type domain-containing protein n=1 Tax=Acrocarpospora corrugata TaxID=35763 RepID=A0A5M3W6T9_9ACTN|nr:helix-turn-helix transcriptional regulator [Acrocarpospora corrugata]GES04506.1 hypothetical protein Acor_65740 [Acrocarpospora corrugata]
MLRGLRRGALAGLRWAGEQVVAEARKRNQAYIDGHRLAERRAALDLTQVEVAERMGVTKSRVSQIERGEVSTVEAIARYGVTPVLRHRLGGAFAVAAPISPPAW